MKLVLKLVRNWNTKLNTTFFRVKYQQQKHNKNARSMNIILYILTQDLQSLTASRYVLESIPELKKVWLDVARQEQLNYFNINDNGDDESNSGWNSSIMVYATVIG